MDSIRIKYEKNGGSACDTTFALKDETVVLSDWEMGPEAMKAFGDSDVEWFYEFSKKDAGRVINLISRKYPQVMPEEMSAGLRSYHDGISHWIFRILFCYVLGFMEKENTAFRLYEYLKENGINISISSF
ncbi:MAG: hypothetical protein MUD12_09440 [Spirochaetes bacterium]|jgi:hypothetical protein|nr:hypothetical protein [Spirochaetota bacterium]